MFKALFYVAEINGDSDLNNMPKFWIKEMAKWVRVVTALAKDLGFRSQFPYGDTTVPGDQTLPFDLHQH